MNVTVNAKPEESSVELVITATAAEIKPFEEKAAKEISKEHQIKGFRPGKVPVKVLAETLGQEHVLQHVLDKAVPHLFVQAAVDEGVEAINRPSISVTKASLGGDVEFTAIVDVLPKVTLGDPRKLSLEKRETKVTDEQIEHELSYLARSRSTYLDVARPAKKGDVVTIDFEISIDGKPIEGGSSKEHPVPLGEGHFVPGFEEGIIGISAGEEKTFTITFPEDYSQKELQGKEAQARIKAHSVQQRSIPEINDEFAKNLGNFESLEKLKNDLKENIGKEQEAKEEERFMSEAAEEFMKLATFSRIPDVLIEREVDHRLQEFAQMLMMQQRTIDDYLAQQKKTLEDVRNEMKDAAEKTVKIGLTLREFAKDQNIKLDEEELTQEVNAQLAHYKTTHQAAENVDPEQLKEHVAAQMKNRKTLEKLTELATKK